MQRILRSLIVVASMTAACSMASAQGILNRLESKLNQLLAPPGDQQPQQAQPPAADNPVQRAGGGPGYLGLKVEDDEARNAVMVRSIIVGSPAEQAGFQLGDEIIGLNDKTVRNMDELAPLLERNSAGTRVEFDIRRDNRRQRISVVLGQRDNVLQQNRAVPDEMRIPPRIAMPQGNVPLRVSDRPSLGITVAPITDESRERYGLTVRRGALISSLRQGGAASRYGLPLGGAIVAFDGRRIDTPDDLINAVRSSRVGEEIELSYYDRDTLFRKRIQLAPSAELPLPTDALNRRDAFTDPPLVLKEGGAPTTGALDRLENSLAPPVAKDPFANPTPPAANQPALNPPTQGHTPLGVAKPPANGEDVGAMRRQIESLKKEIDELQKRLSALEGRPVQAPAAVP